MRILLVRPSYYIDKEDCPYQFREPLGLEYLAAYIRNDCEVEIFDMLGLYWNKYDEVEGNPSLMRIGGSYESLFKKIEKFHPDVVGITSMFLMERDFLFQLTKELKGLFPKIKIIVGGSHPSCIGEDLLVNNSYIDILVIGEGEETLKELIKKNFKNLSEIEGIIFKDSKKNQIFRTSNRKPVNIDFIPFPDRDMVLYKNYDKSVKYAALRTRLGQKTAMRIMSLISNTPIDCLLDKPLNFLRRKFAKNSIGFPSATIVTSRSCPNRCTFCAIRKVWGNMYRMRSAESVIKEISILYNNYGIRHIAIQDDNFTVSKERTIKICKAIIENEFQITIEASSGIYIPSLDREVLTWLKRAGLNSMYLGVESGNQNVLTNIINKNLNLNKVSEVVNICKDLNIKVGGYFVIGFPGEKLENMRETINFALKSKLDWVRLYLLQPFPGSEIYEECLKNGFLINDYDYTKMKIFKERFYIQTPEFKPEQVERLIYEGRKLLFDAGKLSDGFFNK
ncbi:radical SAM protein [Candidatus Wolfebacteria bacterium]|nr:radical SAM protein [Candidatus Wolfebacteria bacterium]